MNISTLALDAWVVDEDASKHRELQRHIIGSDLPCFTICTPTTCTFAHWTPRRSGFMILGLHAARARNAFPSDAWDLTPPNTTLHVFFFKFSKHLRTAPYHFGPERAPISSFWYCHPSQYNSSLGTQAPSSHHRKLIQLSGNLRHPNSSSSMKERPSSCGIPFFASSSREFCPHCLTCLAASTSDIRHHRLTGPAGTDALNYFGCVSTSTSIGRNFDSSHLLVAKIPNGTPLCRIGFLLAPNPRIIPPPLWYHLSSVC